MLEDNEETFLKACESGHFETVERILTTTDIDPTADDNCAFQSAAKHGHVEVMRLLLQQVPAIRKNTKLVCNTFREVTKRCDLEVMKILLKIPEVMQSTATIDFALRSSVENGHLSTTGFLLTLPIIKENANLLREALHIAVRKGYLEIIKLMLESNLYQISDKDTAFRIAAQHNHLSLVKLMLNRPNDIKDSSKNIAFRYAAKNGVREMMEFLLDIPGVDPAGDNNRALANAALGHHWGIVEWLLTMPSVRAAGSLDLIFITAVSSNQLCIVTLLLKLGVDPACCENVSIQLAATEGHLEIVKLLLSLPGINPAANNNDAIQQAASNGHLEVVRLLLGTPAVIVAANDNHAFRHAASNGHLEVVKLLFENFADPTARENYAFQEATRKGHQEVVKWLLTIPAVVDYICMNSKNFQNAVMNSHLDIVKLLLTIPAVRKNPQRIHETFQVIEVYGDLNRVLPIELIPVTELAATTEPAPPSLLPRKNKNTDIVDKNAKRITTDVANKTPKHIARMDDHHLEVMKLLLADPCVDPAANDNYAIRHAVVENNLPSLKLLLADNRVDPTSHGNYVFRHAVMQGYLGIVKLLLATPSFRKNTQMMNEAFQKIAIYGRLDGVELPPIKLAPFKENVKKGKRFEKTTMNDHCLEVMKLLLADPCVDPTANDNYVIQYAAVENNLHSIELLLADSRVDPTANDNYVFRHAIHHLYSDVNRLLVTNSHFMKAFLAHPDCQKVYDSMTHYDKLRFSNARDSYLQQESLRKKTESDFFLNDKRDKDFLFFTTDECRSKDPFSKPVFQNITMQVRK